MQYLKHLPYLKVRCLCILHDSYLKWKENVLVRNQKNSNKNKGTWRFSALRPRQKFKFYLFPCLEAYCRKMTQYEVTVLCCEVIITLTYPPFPSVSTAMVAHHVNLEFFFFIQSETRILSSAFKTRNTGHFIMFCMITNIYNQKTKGPALMELFTATGKLKKFFLTTRDVRCVRHGW
jgi:hypothetical protein